MNTPDFTTDQSNQSTQSGQPSERPLGFWLRTVDHSIKRSMHDALTEDGLGRRAWRTLTLIESGATSVDELDAALPHRRRGPRGRGRRQGFGTRRGFGRPDVHERGEQRTAADAEQAEHAPREHGRPGHPGHDRDFGRGFGPGARFDRDATRGFGGAPFGPGFRGHHGPRGRRRSTEEIVMDFAARGWVTIDASGITLTDAGRAAHTTLRTKVDAVRQTVTDAVSPEDLATTLASLESIARAFGWDESATPEHGHRGRFGHGPRGHRDGFGPRGHRRDRADRPDAPVGTAPDTDH